ncbi:hypothetical protein B0I35DRAFT_473189 [Stachybotrys elegans]|uniref:Uncharacterized protein n=1 Tax=Stachybotrys elegans TaxID=80388 RepID=A0A8K0T5J9_9HYPO|nr:hypothetical protein B0I35DRAFT_473189 [Stachybotrys elegans]
MPDDSSAAASGPSSSRATTTTASAAAVSSGANPVPAGYAIRRTRTFDDVSVPSSRKRSALAPDFSSSPQSSDAPPRRSSNLSDYNLSEARDILHRHDRQEHDRSSESSSLPSLSIAFGLLPALAGALFKDGSAIVTDVMLLGLAGIYLHWSVTQPWAWYLSAQVVRVRHESDAESAIQDESDSDDASAGPRPESPLGSVPEEEADDGAEGEPSTDAEDQSTRKSTSPQLQSALAQLYTHEILALISCSIFPLASAYLLHAIRSQLSRPSEGLVSNYNLTIFVLLSQLRVISHIVKLVQSRTLHLQRFVHRNSPEVASAHAQKLAQVLERLERLEARSSAEEKLIKQSLGSDSKRAKQEASIARDVRNTIQPELDALNRAVRRYEKKATLLQTQTEARFFALDARLGDAIALAAAAAKHSVASKNILLRIIEVVATLLLIPFNAAFQIIMLPLRLVMSLFVRSKRQPMPQRSSRSGRSGKVSPGGRYSGDRVPSRVMKR